MNKRNWLILINTLLLVAIAAQILTSVWMYFFSPPGWIIDLHRLNGAIFLVLLLVHLGLNFSWFKKNNLGHLTKKQ